LKKRFSLSPDRLIPLCPAGINLVAGFVYEIFPANPHFLLDLRKHLLAVLIKFPVFSAIVFRFEVSLIFLLAGFFQAKSNFFLSFT
jgi:hypothetical protein